MGSNPAGRTTSSTRGIPMRLLQILLFVLAVLFVRRWIRSFTGRQKRDSRPPARPEPRAGLDDLTQQDISDADYEEIP